MEHFLYDICLFRWARIGPIYLGNLFMVILFFGGPMLFAWLNQNGHNVIEISIWSFKYIINYVIRLFIKYVFNNYTLRNKILIIMIASLFIPNDIIKFIIISILSFVILNQNIEYQKEKYFEYKFSKKTYFSIYIGILIMLLFILKYPIFIKTVPPLMIIIHVIYWFKSKK